MFFVRNVIADHQNSDLYIDAEISDKYAKQQNVEAEKREKLYRDIAGRLVRNEWAPCHRMKTNLFNILAVQENSYLLGNGVTLKDVSNKEKLGKDFDTKLNQAGYAAITQTLSYIFWNLDHIEVFRNLEFAPLVDETTSSLRAGVRWWQISENKPLRATLYEEDGYTEYIWNLDKDGKIQAAGEVFREKRSYQVSVSIQPNDEMQITNMQNYPSFPIVPLWSNSNHICPFNGIKATIDQIDELTNALNDDLTETQLYWLIQGADGMDRKSLAQFMSELRQDKVANPMDGQNIQPYTVNIPTTERQSEIDRLKRQVYEDFQALDINEIKGGAVTATQIKAAFEPLNHKVDDFEMCVIECLNRLFKLIPGLEDEEPTFSRSLLVNQSEMIQVINQSAQYLSSDYVTTKILTILGDGDKAEEMLEQLKAEEQAQYAAMIEQQQVGDTNEEQTGADISGAIDDAEKAIGGGLNGAQTQSLISVVQQYANGTLTHGQAVNIISKSIGVSKEEAANILDSE